MPLRLFAGEGSLAARPGNLFDPRGNATRAEAAEMLFGIIPSHLAPSESGELGELNALYWENHFCDYYPLRRAFREGHYPLAQLVLSQT